MTFFTVLLHDPAKAQEVVDKINALFPDVLALLSTDFAHELPNFEQRSAGTAAVSALAILVGGVTMMNTMLMSVHDRTCAGRPEAHFPGDGPRQRPSSSAARFSPALPFTSSGR